MGLSPDGDDSGMPTQAVTARAYRAPAPNLWRDRAFVTLALGMALGLFAQIGLIAHMFSLLVPALGAQGAGLAAGLATAAAIGGRTVVGWTMPANTDRRVVGVVNYAVQIVGCAAFLAAGGTNVPLLMTGVVLFGLGIGNTTSMPPLIAQTEFATEDAGRVVALVTAVSQGFYAFAPAVFGMLREAPVAAGGASVPMVFVVAASLQLAAAAAYWIGRDAWRSRAAGSVVPSLLAHRG